MDDPAKKQYLIFSAVISFIVSFVINFFFTSATNIPLAGGFPITLYGSEGIGLLFGKTLNTLIIGLCLTPLIYFGIQWLQNRGTGGSNY